MPLLTCNSTIISISRYKKTLTINLIKIHGKTRITARLIIVIATTLHEWQSFHLFALFLVTRLQIVAHLYEILKRENARKAYAICKSIQST